MIVYTLGEVDYDIRSETPRAVFSTAEAAKAHAGPGITWSFQEATGGWWGRRDNGEEFDVTPFVVDEPDVDPSTREKP